MSSLTGRGVVPKAPRVCPRCGDPLPPRHAGRGAQRRFCSDACRWAQHRVTNAAKARAYEARWRAANPDKVRVNQARHRATEGYHVKRQARNDGRREIINAQARALYHAAPEHARAMARCRGSTPEAKAAGGARQKARRAAPGFLEAQAERDRALYAHNSTFRIRKKAAAHRRHKRVARATVAWTEHGAIEELRREAVEMEELTGIPHQSDHIIPLKSALVCGLHVVANLRVIPASENASKRNRFDPDTFEGP